MTVKLNEREIRFLDAFDDKMAASQILHSPPTNKIGGRYPGK
jgi:hypothetical protein